MEIERKPLHEFTDRELFIFLENNSTIDLMDLSAICSEVLRRMLKKTNGVINELEK